MKVFISWSGERSKGVAQALRDWLPNVIQAIEPWMSEADVAKGARWGLDMARELDETRVGIICLTRENLSAPWILFEAGALSKTLEETYVCPYLLDVRPADLEGPLAQFQATLATNEDTRKLVQTINRALGDEALTEERVNKAFEVWWPQLEESLTNIPGAEGKPESRRSPDDTLEELLIRVRAIEREVTRVRKTQEVPLVGFMPSSGSLDIAAGRILDVPVVRATPVTISATPRELEIAGRMQETLEQFIRELKEAEEETHADN